MFPMANDSNQYFLVIILHSKKQNGKKKQTRINEE